MSLVRALAFEAVVALRKGEELTSGFHPICSLLPAPPGCHRPVSSSIVLSRGETISLFSELPHVINNFAPICIDIADERIALHSLDPVYAPSASASLNPS